eukprot:351127-Chlamydomonas_euryale.AAC.8
METKTVQIRCGRRSGHASQQASLQCKCRCARTSSTCPDAGDVQGTRPGRCPCSASVDVRGPLIHAQMRATFRARTPTGVPAVQVSMCADL